MQFFICVRARSEADAAGSASAQRGCHGVRPRGAAVLSEAPFLGPHRHLAAAWAARSARQSCRKGDKPALRAQVVSPAAQEGQAAAAKPRARPGPAESPLRAGPGGPWQRPCPSWHQHLAHPAPLCPSALLGDQCVPG